MVQRKDMGFFVYILKCSDSSYYTGSTDDISRRLYEHVSGANSKSYTFRRRPVQLVWCEEYPTKYEARLHEHQIKGWSRKNKDALIKNDWQTLHEIVLAQSKNRAKKSDISSLNGA
jgi:predicted GIY-YIG superfamily endonuclease